MSSDTDIRVLTPADAASLAVLHAQAFDSPWDVVALGDLLGQSGVVGLGAAGLEVTDPEGAGFILCRVVADEAEILTLATVPSARRKGLGRALVEAACKVVALRGATRLFLEVAEDNAPARALYDRTGFVEAGRRRRYYARPQGPSVDALVLSRALIEDFIRHLPSR